MLDSSVFLENSGGGSAASDGFAVELRNEAVGEEGGRNSAGSRWPREETLGLLKIRSDMDIAFRDSNLKAPLWDEVSRKLGELGYCRNAKKCKEKFENIYKYHKRTKNGRSIRHNGKNYRFFEQLELLETQFSVPSTPLNQIPSYAMETTEIATSDPTKTVLPKPISPFQDFMIPFPNKDCIAEFMSASTSTASSSGKDSEGSSMKKRKLEDYFERLMKDVLGKQEDLQNKFLEAVEKCEKKRIAREEAWKLQEMARIKREQEIFAQERSIAAAKDAAVLAFLQKITQQNLPSNISEILDPLFNNKTRDNKQENILEKRNSNLQENAIVVVGGGTCANTEKRDNNRIGEKNSIQTSSSRWPKAEVESLILLKTDLDMQYQDNGPKGPLWEEISLCMKKLGYERSAKRCKEKWENINKYYKRVKESNKKRPNDSKTCPYFSMLESIYANKSKKSRNNDTEVNGGGGGCSLKPEQILMQMMGQVQHQHSQQQKQQNPQQLTEEYNDNDGDDSDHQEQEDGDAAEEDDDESGDGYQIVANNNMASNDDYLGLSRDS